MVLRLLTVIKYFGILKEWGEREKSELIKKAKDSLAKADHYEAEAQYQAMVNNQVIAQNKSLLEKNINLTNCLQEIKKTIVAAPIFQINKHTDYVRTIEASISRYKEGK